MILIILKTSGQTGQALYFVDSNSIHLRWTGVYKTTLQGYKVYRRNAGAADWVLLTHDPIKPVYAYNELSKILGYKTAAFLQLLGGDANAKGDITPALLNRVYQDGKTSQLLGVMSLVNPEYAVALGERFDDRDIRHNENYEYRITYTDNGDEKEWAKTGLIHGDKIMSVAVPKDLKATALDAAVALDWKREPELMKNASVVTYSVYSAKDILGPYQKENFFGTLSVTVNNRQTDNEHYKVSFLENGTKYFFTVKAVNAFGIESFAAPVVEATPTAGTIPFVTGFTITASGKKAKLSWNENAEVEIYRAASKESFSRVYPPVVTTLKPVRYWYDNNTAEGTDYRYFVKVVNSTATSDTLRWRLPDVTPPSRPINVSATAKRGVVVLQWEANKEKDLLGYEVERASDPSLKTRFLLTSKPVTKNSFADSLDYRSQTLFGYVVYAVDLSYNRSLPSELVKIKMPDYQPPATPYITSLQQTDKGIKLQWQSAREADIAKFIVYGSHLTNKNYSRIAEVKALYYEGPVADTGTYFYSVSAIDSAGNESSKSYPQEIFISGDSFRKAPVNGTIEHKSGTVKLHWKPAAGATPAGYIITRVDPSGKRLDIAQLAPGTNDFTDTHLAKGKMVYEIRARNEKWQMGKPLILQIEIK